MKFVFDFPILHSTCDTCPNRFECMTERTHEEVEWGIGDNTKKYFSKLLPWRVGLACFRVEPYTRVYRMRLDSSPIDGKKKMILEVWWD